VTARFTLLGCLALAACRFGGPSGDPEAYVAFPVDGGEDASAGASSGGAQATDDDSGGSNSEASAGDDTNGDDAAGDDAVAGDDAAGGTCGRTIPVCDPVHNTGCNPFQQCDVDPSQMTTPTGLCLFYSGSDASAPGACMTTLITETCPAKSTCVSGACRALCFCDSDCPASQCCSDTSGPPGFRLCRACP
jgi:hypothetical protein